jgi:hypothetical protein
VKLPIGTYSFYNQFENCPRKAFEIYVARSIPYVESPEMAWGNKVHAAMENRIKHGSPLPDEMKAAEETGAQFHQFSKELPVRVEWQLAMLQNGRACDYKDPAAFFRGKLDNVTLDLKELPTYAWMVDWKTGNVREEPFELETNALLLKANYPSLETIVGEYFWMKTGQNGLRYTFSNHAETFNRLWRLRGEAEGYLRTGSWPERKNPLCGWCDVLKCVNNTKLKRLAKEGK